MDILLTPSAFLKERAGEAKAADMLKYLQRAPAGAPIAGNEIGA